MESGRRKKEEGLFVEGPRGSPGRPGGWFGISAWEFFCRWWREVVEGKGVSGWERSEAVGCRDDGLRGGGLGLEAFGAFPTLYWAKGCSGTRSSVFYEGIQEAVALRNRQRL